MKQKLTSPLGLINIGFHEATLNNIQSIIRVPSNFNLINKICLDSNFKLFYKNEKFSHTYMFSLLIK